MTKIADDTTDFNTGAVSGLVSLAVDAGLPLDLALPVEPPNLGWPLDDQRRINSGKAPALPNSIGDWVKLEGWNNKPIHPENLRDAGQAGCNVGMVLGKVSTSGMHALAIDIDCQGGDTVTVLQALEPHLGADQLIYREARKGRALCLVNLSGPFASRKRIWNVRRNGQDVGKVEMLAHGQQCVIAGRHWTDKPITWHCVGEPGQSWPVPPLNRFPLAAYPDQDAVVAMLEGVWQSLREAGYEFVLTASGGTGANTDDASKAPEWLTVAILVDAIQRLENGRDVDREKYVDVAQRIAGARHGIIAHHGALSPEEDDQIAEAFAKWASKHVTEKPASYEDELAKWCNDWIKRGQRTGWDQLVACARSLGVDLPNESAQREFPAEPPPAGESAAGAESAAKPMATQESAVGQIVPGVETSDDAVALRFTRRYAGRLRYCAEWGQWLGWSGHVWQVDRTYFTLHLMRGICRELMQELSDDPDGTLTRGQSESLTSRTKAYHCLDLAKSAREHAMTADRWDADPWLLNTPAGIVDLRTGKTCPHDPALHMTKTTRVSPGGGCPLWLAFLNQITAGDQELIGYLQRVAGYCLTGLTHEQALFFGYGTGGNGKGTYLNTLTWIMGDYATVATMEAFTETHAERHTTDLAMLRGARLVTAQETKQGQRWDEQKIKALTGGDPITARFMRQDNFTYLPQFKLFIAGNHKPGLRTVDQAIKRRMNLIPFVVRIMGAAVDKGLAEKLKAEAGGILAWMVAGCCQWQETGLRPPEAVLRATESYMEAQDGFSAWVAERCQVAGQIVDGKPLATSIWAPIGELYRSWQSWCQSAGEHVQSQRAFGDTLEDNGFVRMRSDDAKKVRGHRGIRLTPPVEPPPGLVG